ncbi:MAG TPA: family 1 glycosylhydrolase, partial [Spirochaetota bacterium]|nr:family 1 glycosylhydrolase [Spirochaetota bacterium]
MAQKEDIVFPKGFLWGTATAAHQIEGGTTNNNWWLFEK